MDPRLDPQLLTPTIPRELRALVHGDTAVSGVRAVGQPGKVGVVHGTFGLGHSGRTVLRERFVKSPMHVSRPLYVDPADPTRACLYLRTLGGGVAENDRIRQRFHVSGGARALVTTQAATGVYRMNAGCGTQWTSFDVAGGAQLEYVPGHTTLYAGSRLIQRTDIRVAASASVLAAEVTLTGRLAHGEAHRFDGLSQTLRIDYETARGWEPVLSDHVCVLGQGRGRSEVLYGRWPVWGSIVAIPPSARQSPGLLAAVRNGADGAAERGGGEPSTLVGASSLVGNAGVVIRVAGTTPEGVRRRVDELYDICRRELLGAPFFDLRRM